MITINPARILHLDNRIGSLEKGKDADFLVFKLDGNQTYENLFDREMPEYVFSSGEVIAKHQNLLLKL